MLGECKTLLHDIILQTHSSYQWQIDPVGLFCSWCLSALSFPRVLYFECSSRFNMAQSRFLEGFYICVETLS